MAEILEGVKPETEGEKATPKEELEPTKIKEKSTVSITETPEFRTALDKALGKGLESTNRQLSEAKTERDTFKSKAEQATKEAKEATSTLEETREHVASLESDIETLEENETDPNKLSKLRKDLRDARGKVRQEVKDQQDTLDELRKTLEAERLEWAETVAEAQVFKFDGEIAKIVDEYDGDVTANFTKLKATCEKAGIKTKEGAEAVAETFLVKKAEEPALVDDSSVTTGGGDRLGDKPVAEQIKILNERALKKIRV